MPYEYLVPILTSSVSAVISAIIGWVVYRMQKRANKMDEGEGLKELYHERSDRYGTGNIGVSSKTAGGTIGTDSTVY